MMVISKLCITLVALLFLGQRLSDCFEFNCPKPCDDEDFLDQLYNIQPVWALCRTKSEVTKNVNAICYTFFFQPGDSNTFTMYEKFLFDDKTVLVNPLIVKNLGCNRARFINTDLVIEGTFFGPIHNNTIGAVATYTKGGYAPFVIVFSPTYHSAGYSAKLEIEKELAAYDFGPDLLDLVFFNMTLPPKCITKQSTMRPYCPYN